METSCPFINFLYLGAFRFQAAKRLNYMTVLTKKTTFLCKITLTVPLRVMSYWSPANCDYLHIPITITYNQQEPRTWLTQFQHLRVDSVSNSVSHLSTRNLYLETTDQTFRVSFLSYERHYLEVLSRTSHKSIANILWKKRWSPSFLLSNCNAIWGQEKSFWSFLLPQHAFNWGARYVRWGKSIRIVVIDYAVSFVTLKTLNAETTNHGETKVYWIKSKDSCYSPFV